MKASLAGAVSSELVCENSWCLYRDLGKEYDSNDAPKGFAARKLIVYQPHTDVPDEVLCEVGWPGAG